MRIRGSIAALAVLMLSGCGSARVRDIGSVGAVVRFTVADTHPQVLAGVSVDLVRENGTRISLCTTDSSGNCEVKVSVLRAAGRGLLLFCKEMYFCGALELGEPRFLDFSEHLIVLAPFAIS